MNRLISLILSLAIIATSGCATIKTSDDLSEVERAAIKESRLRIVVYRQTIQSIENGHDNIPRTPAEAAEAARQLRVLINKEQELQCAILHKDPRVAIIARDVLKTTGDVLYVTGEVALCTIVVAGLLAVIAYGHAPFNPTSNNASN